MQLTKLSIKEAEDEITKANEIIYKSCGIYPTFVRPPYGSWSDTLEKKTNMRSVLWTIDPLDWKVLDKDQVVRHVVSNAKDGSIILLHDIYKTSVEAALEIVDELTKKGYKFATIEELQID
ncbi:hypothetical protein P261_01592 [Lachnospiraceae bacterium TWA4]|nr:hypothetical protein P261_01592 [Lachnospiraceae bacterium TWA4]